MLPPYMYLTTVQICAYSDTCHHYHREGIVTFELYIKLTQWSHISGLESECHIIMNANKPHLRYSWYK